MRKAAAVAAKDGGNPRRRGGDFAEGKRRESDGDVLARRLGQERLAVEDRVEPVAVQALAADDGGRDSVRYKGPLAMP